MGGFSRQSFERRSHKLGDESESVFDTWAADKGIEQVTWGFNRPPFRYFKYLPSEVRWTPDRLIEDTNGYIKTNWIASLKKHAFVEVKSVGKDQVVKIKSQHIDMWMKMQEFYKRRILVFVYDSYYQRVSLSHTANDMHKLAPDMVEKAFYDGNVYREFPTSTFIWESITKEDE